MITASQGQHTNSYCQLLMSHACTLPTKVIRGFMQKHLNTLKRKGDVQLALHPKSLHAVLYATSMSKSANTIIEKIYDCKDTVISTSIDRQELSNG
jgi:quinolinate synthase